MQANNLSNSFLQTEKNSHWRQRRTGVAELLLGGGRRQSQTKPQAPSKASIQLGDLLEISSSIF